MPLNGSGTYSLATPEYPFIPDTDILASDMNTILEDIQAALNTVMYRDGQATATANFSMGSYKITSMGDGSADADATTYSQVFKNPTFTASLGTGVVITGTVFTLTAAIFNATVPDVNFDSTTFDLITSGASTLTIGAALGISSGTTMALDAGTDLTITVGGDYSNIVTASITETSGTTYDLNVGTVYNLVAVNDVNITAPTIDLAGNTTASLTSASIGVTQVPGTDNTTLATTAFVQQASLAATMPSTVAAVLFYNLNYI